jgi:tRNA pseudouridine32 synthase/23S rRNA pseudouridine746 synthase
MIHFFDQPVSHIALPERFTYPFNYTPHPLCVLAAEEVKAYISTKKEWQEELALGKMFGVLIVQTQEEGSSSIGYLAAFSGNLAGKNLHPYFVPPVYDLLQPQGFFKIEEEQISAINVRISELEVNPHYLHLKEKLDRETEQARLALIQAKEELKTAKRERELRRQSSPALSEEEQDALIRESQYQKAELKRLERGWKERIKTLEEEIITFETEIEKLKNERKQRSAALQQKLFEQFRMLNAKGEIKDLCTIFEQTVQNSACRSRRMCLAQIAAICLPSPTETIGYGRILVGKLSEDGGTASRLLLPLVQRKMRTDSATYAARTGSRRESTFAPCTQKGRIGNCF